MYSRLTIGLLWTLNTSSCGTYTCQQHGSNLICHFKPYPALRCCGSGLETALFLTPDTRSGMGKNPDLESGINISSYISESLAKNFWLKILQFSRWTGSVVVPFYTGSGMGLDGKFRPTFSSLHRLILIQCHPPPWVYLENGFFAVIYLESGWEGALLRAAEPTFSRL
jgi:hypothetical protein